MYKIAKKVLFVICRDFEGKHNGSDLSSSKYVRSYLLLLIEFTANRQACIDDAGLYLSAVCCRPKLAEKRPGQRADISRQSRYYDCMLSWRQKR